MVLAIAITAIALLGAGPAQAGTFYLKTCGYSGSPAPFGAGSGGGVAAGAQCGNGLPGYELSSPGGVANYAGAYWSTTAPAGISITHVYTQFDSSTNIQGAGYYTSFNWDNGTTGQLPNSFGQNPGATGCCLQNFASQTLSWAMTCRFSTCSSPASMSIGQLTVTLSETQAPSITGGGALWNSSGWVRGTWQVGFGASDPSGICSSSVALGGQGIGGPGASPEPGQLPPVPRCAVGDQHRHEQIGRGRDGAGDLGHQRRRGERQHRAHRLRRQHDPISERVGSDLRLANAGTQYVTAHASAGPSGVSGIACSVDGTPYQDFPGAAATVAINGPGVHNTTCVSFNNAHDAAGNVAASAPQTETTVIGEPTLSAIWFATVHNPLRCQLVRKRQRVPAHYTYVRRHHHRVRVRVRAHYRTVKVKECHARVVKRRIAYWVTVRRHHHRVRIKHYRTIRSVVFPSEGHALVRHVRFGSRARLQGWLGTTWLAPMGGQAVLIYGAANNERGNFRVVGFAQTNANGVWSYTLPPGPSRIIEVEYPGALGGAVTSSVSSQIKLDVAAHVHLVRTPRSHVTWGSKLRFAGRLAGGYVPARGALLRVRLGIGSAHTTVATVSTRRNGSFSFSYRFGAGNVVRRYWFQFLTLPQGDYPFTQGASRKVYVTVG